MKMDVNRPGSLARGGSLMRRVFAILLFVGCIISLTAAQQPPPPPPPPAASQPPSVQPTEPAPAAPQQQAPDAAAQQQSVTAPQPQIDPQQQIQQQQQQIQQQQQQIQQLQQQSHQQQEAASAAANDAKNLPEADRVEAQRAEAQRAEAQKELDRIQAKQEIAELRVKDQGRLRESRAVLHELLTGTTGKVGIPNALIRQSKCVVVIPAVKKAAFAFGA